MNFKMNKETYYWGISLIALAQITNSLLGAAMIYFIDALPIDFLELVFSLLCLGLVIFFAYKNSLLSSLVLLLSSIYIYWNNLMWGLTRFSFENQHIQPLITVWLAIFSIIFCIIGGAYLFFKRFPKR